jgi:teichuronic acid biosynthesis glycosyltransferase TuaG
MEPLVSIITPNYNSEKFITECIDSVRNQTYKKWELIIIDDCSTDNSVSIIKKLQATDARIKLIKLNKNSGPAVARNKGIEEAKGTYIAFLDSDDFWLPQKLKVQVPFMQTKKTSLSFSSYYSVNENKKNQKLLKAKETINYNKLLKGNCIGCLTAMYSVEKLGKVYFPILKKRQDWALWLKILKDSNLAYGILEPLAFYRRRKSSVSSNKIEVLKYNWFVYRKFEKIGFLKSLYLLLILFFNKISK